MRGYNLSSRPADVKAYDSDHLTADIRASFKNAVPSQRSSSATTGAEASPGPPR